MDIKIYTVECSVFIVHYAVGSVRYTKCSVKVVWYVQYMAVYSKKHEKKQQQKFTKSWKTKTKKYIYRYFRGKKDTQIM